MEIRRCIIVGMLGLFIIASASLALAQPEYSIRLNIGEVRVMDFPEVEQIASGNEDVVNHRALESGEFLLMGVGQGETSVHIWQKGGRRTEMWVSVNGTNVSSSLRLARSVSRNIPGLKARDFEGRIIFEGQISARHAKTFELMLRHFPENVNMVTIREFDVKPLVRMDVKILEIRKRAMSQLGVNWQESAAGPIVGIHKAVQHNGFYSLAQESPTDAGITEAMLQAVPGDYGLYTYGGLTSVLGSRIDLLAQNGDAAVIAAPKLSAKSGESAEFISGGEFPIPMTDELGRMVVEFKEYGVLLKITPEVDEQGTINTYVSTELSVVDFATEINNVPGLTKRSSNTVVNLNSGDTLVISGLAQANTSNQYQKMPFLGDIPGIGWLFKSREKGFDEGELVITVTPYVFDPASKLNTDLLKIEDRMQDHFKNYDITDGLLN